ncbi:hypothetical protein [Bradyrhizobium brasilense]|uniref:hypothetical protein n=1 Tax=Bradyrhizobium brasilense TaxID=1419277 RepID=UPI00115FE471|nr:hypothetical protein [Bradyrhizobium brasilense]
MIWGVTLLACRADGDFGAAMLFAGSNDPEFIAEARGGFLKRKFEGRPLVTRADPLEAIQGWINRLFLIAARAQPVHVLPLASLHLCDANAAPLAQGLPGYRS